MLEDASRGTGWAAISRAAAQGGRQLAQGFGGEDPRISKAKALQQVQQEMMQEGWESKVNTAEFYEEAARKVREIDPPMSMKMMQKAQEMRTAADDKAYKRKESDLGMQIKQKQLEAFDKEKQGATAIKFKELSEIFGEDEAKKIMRGGAENNLSRFKGNMGGKSVIGFSDKKGNTYVRQGGQLIKNPQGLTEITTGRTKEDVAASGFAKPVINKLQQTVVDTTQGLDRLENMMDGFKPEYLTIPDRVVTAAMDQYEKWGGDLSEEDKQRVGEASKFYQNAIENINLYIKYITGAQMSYQESDRLRLAAPDAGEGVFGADGPTKFRNKAKNAIRGAKMARARALYVMRHGLSVKESKVIRDGVEKNNITFPISLNQMSDIVNNRGAAIKKQLLKENPKLDEESLKESILNQLEKEFFSE